MSFLAPWALLLAGLAAVPLLLHLLRRRSGERVDFPAVRYLLRAEKEHAREVRLRNFLLMLLRVAIVLAVALAAARPFGPLLGAGHPPTAVVLLVDNSMSTAAAGADGPALTALRAAASAVLAEAREADAVTLVTADAVAITGTRDDLTAAVDGLEPLVGAGDLGAALQRASAVLAAAELPERRLAIVTDGQRSAWADSAIVVSTNADSTNGAETVAAAAWPVTLFVLDRDTVPNRALLAVQPEPRQWTPRGALRISWRGDTASWRVTLAGAPGSGESTGSESAARGTESGGTPILARIQPRGRGWLTGSVELDPDELRGDDVRHFAVFVGEPPALNVPAGSDEFLRGAVDALVDAGRARRGAAIRVAEATAARRPALLFAPRDPLRLADANRALASAGVPWRFGARRTGAAPLRGAGVEGAEARVWYELQWTGSAATNASAAETIPDTLVRVGSDPWAVAGDGYVLVASAAHPDHGTLPLRADFLPWMDQVLAERLTDAQGQVQERAPGAALPVPAGVTAVLRADGTREPVAPGASWRVPNMAGVHFWLRSEQRAGAVVVNPEPRESELAPMPLDSLAAQLGARRAYDRPAPFASATFAGGSRRALDLPLLSLALALLLLESVLARRGRGGRSAS